MDKYDRILYIINQQGMQSQRKLADAMEVSLGQVNYLLKEMADKGLLEKTGKIYRVTREGKKILEEKIRIRQTEKLDFTGNTEGVKLAVILAAGCSPAFEKPEGLLEIGGMPLIEHMIQALHNQGIEKIIVVVGDRKEQYEEYFAHRGIILVENKRYKWSGTMASLFAAKEYLTEDFLLAESNQILEEVAIEKILTSKEQNCMLLASPSDSMDEAYVELDENGSIFRISKDIKQLNRVDAELIGVSKISMELFEKMGQYYGKNENPYLNYEYAIESIGRIYRIAGILVDDLIWSVIENETLYQKASRILYPKMMKRVVLRKENKARETLQECLHLKDEDIEQVSIGGGMTNQNFFVKVKGKHYILRIPGACTEVFINRTAEQYNSRIASGLGLNPPILYFDPVNGVKVTEYIRGARTLNPGTARLEAYMRKTTAILKKLHNSQIKLQGDFNVWNEYDKYKCEILKNGGAFYEGFGELEEFFYHLQSELRRMKADRRPCHNDLVAENFVSDEAGRMYLIDWEYAGYNDPLWDVAAHLLECEFSNGEEELYLQYYLEKEPGRTEKQKLLLFKICQDVLWSAWTIAKETKGEDFGAYGESRYQRALNMKKEYESEYEEKHEEE